MPRPYYDPDQHDLADRMSRENPQWLVFYGTYHRDYSAFPWFNVPFGTILHAADPSKLVNQMRETELRYPPGPVHLG